MTAIRNNCVSELWGHSAIRRLAFAFFLQAHIGLFCLNLTAQEKPAPPPIDTLPTHWNFDQLPLGINASALHPPENAFSEEKFRLGRKLFFDPILSEDGSMSCASCHRPEHGFSSPEPIAIGVGGAHGERNAPSVLNRGLAKHLFWDGRSVSLEEQALQPIVNPKELASSLEAVIGRIQAVPSYVLEFENAFKTENSARETRETSNLVTAPNLAKALACFQRSLIVGNSAVDQFRASRYDALTPRQRTGMWIFESRGRCWQCHSGDNFSDEQFHNTGVSYGQSNRDLGRFAVTKVESDRFAMKTPTLRAIAETAPYMHDGSISSLREVVEFYNKGGSPQDPNLDSRIKPLNLSAEEVDALADFLEALTPIQAFIR